MDHYCKKCGGVLERNVNHFLVCPAEHCCGTFRQCQFEDGLAWIVVLAHAHAEGEVITVDKRDGTRTEVVLGAPIHVTQGSKVLENCYRIAPLLVCDEPKKVEIQEHAQGASL
jgi:hypothetical protein